MTRTGPDTRHTNAHQTELMLAHTPVTIGEHMYKVKESICVVQHALLPNMRMSTSLGI